MATRVQDIGAFALVVGAAFALQAFGKWDAADFIAGSALWYGIRAWAAAEHVNTAHKNSEAQ